jgi:tetratricopeptide (TPR) repeat protein
MKGKRENLCVLRALCVKRSTFNDGKKPLIQRNLFKFVADVKPVVLIKQVVRMQQTLIELIGKGKTKQVLNELCPLTAADSAAYAEAIKLSARFARYDKRQTGRLEDPSVLSIELNQINDDLLAFVNALEDNDAKDGLRRRERSGKLQGFPNVNPDTPILRGRIITKAESITPLRGVIVGVVGTKDEAHTDAHGYFNIACSGRVYGDEISLTLYLKDYKVVDESALRNVFLRTKQDASLDIQMEEVAQYELKVAKSEKDIISNVNQVSEQNLKVSLAILEKLNAAPQSAANDKQIQDLHNQIRQIEAERDNAIGQARDIAAKLLVFDPEHASEDAKRAHALFLEGKLPEAYAALDEAKMQERAKAAQNILQQAISDYMQKGQLAIANGKFDAAERLYTEGSRLDDTNIDNLWTLALFLSGQNEKLKSITYYERALLLSKTDDLTGTFSNNLGAVYSAVNKMPEAKNYYLQSFDIYTRLSKSNPQQFDPNLATTAMNLGNYYSEVNKLPEAETYYLQSLDICKRLSESNPQQFEPFLAATAMNLGIHYQTVNDMPKAETFYRQSFSIYSRLSESNSEDFEPDLARMAMNLGLYYATVNNMPEAETYYLNSLAIRTRLSESNPQQFEPDLATTANNLGEYYRVNNNMPKAEKYFLQSLAIRTRLSKSNPQQFEPHLASTAMNLGNYYSDVNKMPEGEAFYMQSLNIYIELSKSNPQQFEPDLARTALNLGIYYHTVNKMPEAEKYYLQSFDIYTRLSESNLQQFEPHLAAIAMNLGNYYSDISNILEAERYSLQSLDIFTRLSKINPQQFELDLAFILNNYGVFCGGNKDLDKAYDLCSRALALWQKILLNGQMNYLDKYNQGFSNLGDVADAFIEQKSYAKAVAVQTERAKSADILRGILENGETAAAEAYGILSWFQLFTKDYANAEQSAQRGLALDEAQTWIQVNLAHALLCQHQDAAAKKVYDALKNASNTEGSPFRDVLTEDFEALAQAGVDTTQLDKARAWVNE